MKKTCAFLTGLLFLTATLAVAQPVAGKKFEFSTAFSYSSIKFSGDTESDSLLSFPVRLGYYVWKGLEIEPEFVFMDFDPGQSAFNLNGNLAYNFKTSGHVVPFVLAGMGFGNGLAYGSIVQGGTSITATLFNLGGGVKYVIGNSGAVRLEYRYTHNSLSKGDLPSQGVNLHQVFIGVSLFF